MRIGQGYDSHRLTEGRPLILGGVTIPHTEGLSGHSDADCLLHAVIDALFGAAALGDIGTHFPDTDPKYKGADSMKLLEEAVRLVKKNYRIVNLDATILTQAPRMAPHIPAMTANIASALGVQNSQVSIKAKTNEGMDAVGRKEGIVCLAVCLLDESENV